MRKSTRGNRTAKAAKAVETRVEKTVNEAAAKAEAVKETVEEAVKAVVTEDVKEVIAETVKEAAETVVEATETVKEEVKKAAAKTTAKKSVVKEEVVLQYLGKEISKDDLMKQVKEIWTKQLKKKVGDMKSVALYLKPEENKAYYVVNGDVTGSIDL